MDTTPEQFDYAAHKQRAVSEYLERQNFYVSLSEVVRRILEKALLHSDVAAHSIQARAKDPTSFGKKAAQPSEADPNRPMYSKPIEQITDLAGVRVITFFPRDLVKLDAIVTSDFEIVERSDKSA